MVSPSVSSSGANLAGAVLFLAMASNYYTYHRRQIQLKQEYEARIAKLEETRRAERTGRVRAEMKLRTVLKNKKEDDDNTDITNGNGNSIVGRDDEDQDDDAADETRTADDKQLRPLTFHRIGTIKSPYTKRMGTPRQGALVPSGRGCIQLDVPVECVMGLENYSHAWILFSFHANTDSPSPSSALEASTHKTNELDNYVKTMWSNLSKTKIRPPRGNGIKVGMLATRSPHRPNNIGLSLIRISNLDIKNKRLHITALDLVDGTPVYDIKPCVPWDVPGHYDDKALSVPKWVSCDDELESVIFDPVALDALATCVHDGKLAPLYTANNDGIVGATETIREILAQDPRASNSNNSNKRGTSSSSSGRRHDNIESYKMLFCSVEVEFRVDKVNGGCRDGVVTVMNIRHYTDLDVVKRVDGIPVLLR